MTERFPTRPQSSTSTSSSSADPQRRARVYRAWTMADALAAVRQDLGADAMILHARAISKRGFLGFGRKDFVEVAAAPALAESRLKKLPRREATSTSRAPARDDESLVETQRARGLAAYAERATATPQRAPVEAPSFDLAGEQAKTRRLAREMLAQFEREGAERKAASLNEVATSAEANNARAAQANSKGAASMAESRGIPRESPRENPRENVAQRFVLKSTPGIEKGSATTAELVIETAAPVVTAKVVAASVAAPIPPRVPLLAPPTLHVSELDAMGSVVDAVLDATKPIAPVSRVFAQGLTTRVSTSNTKHAPRGVLPTHALEAAYRALIEQEVAEQLADAILARVTAELSPAQAADPVLVRQSLVGAIASMLPATDGDSDSLAARVIAKKSKSGARAAFHVAFIGPTGVGKTTSIAKIAAMLRLRHGLQVGLVTADTYRIAAVEQLRTYAQILALPLEVAMQPDDLTAACERLASCDVVLIDTAGRSQNDKSRLAELGEFLRAGAADEVHLVLSATSSERALLREAAAFGALGVDRIVLTKLDEAAGFGTLLSVTRKLGMRISFVTTGQEVPKDLEPASARRFAEFMLQSSNANENELSARVGLRS